jgi:hypothetical protein
LEHASELEALESGDNVGAGHVLIDDFGFVLDGGGEVVGLILAHQESPEFGTPNSMPPIGSIL